MEIEDLLGGARFKVTERRSTIGFEIGDLIEARLCWEGQEVVFTKTVPLSPARRPGRRLAAIEHGAGEGDDPGRTSSSSSPAGMSSGTAHGHVNAARVYKGGA